LRSIAWAVVVWLAVLATATVDRLLSDGQPDWLWVCLGLGAVFLVGIWVNAWWWVRGSLWVLVPIAAVLVWQIIVVFNKAPNESPDIGAETAIVVFGAPIVLGLGALLIWGVAWLGVTIGGGSGRDG
jgi:hypothetical protein